MKKILLLILGLLVAFFAECQMVRSVKTWNNGLYQYIEYRPMVPGQYPAILFLPGSGERGADINLVDRQGIPKLLKSGYCVPYIVICPQIPTTKTGFYKSEFTALRKILDQYPERHITGLSLGGSGTFNFVSYDTAYFSSAGAVCGKPAADFHLYQTIPLKVWHGVDDTVVPPAQAVMLVAKLEPAGAPVNHQYLSGFGHGIWGNVYAPGNADGYWVWLENVRSQSK